MSNQDKSFNEPKIQLTLNIMKQDNEITYHLDNNDEIAAAHDIALLLRRLEINETDTEMINLKKQITLENYDLISEQQIYKAYEIIHDFLNRTYYKGFSNNRPPTRESTIQSIGKKINGR